MSNYIPASELAQIRADIAATFDSVCTIQRAAPGGDGRRTGAPATIASNIACEVVAQVPPKRMQDVFQFMDRGMTGAEMKAHRFITLPDGQDIQKDDLIITGGNTYVVLDTYDDSTDSFCNIAHCNRVKAGHG